MNRYKKAAVAMLAVAALTALVGCSSQGTSTGSKTPITLWYWPNSLDDKVVAQAKVHFPQAQFSVLKSADVLTKYQAALATGSAPDISMVGGNISDYFSAGDKLVDYATVPAYKKVAGDYLESLTKMATDKNGHVYGVSPSSSPYAFYYKPAALAAIGLPTEPDQVADALSTWDKYDAAAIKSAKESGGKTLICGDEQTLFMAQQEQRGQRFVTANWKYLADNAASKAAWDRNVALRDAGACPALPGPNDFTADLVSGKISAFVGYGYQGAALTQSLPDESGQWRVASLPGGPAQDGGGFMVIKKSTKDVNLAVSIVTWITNAQNQATQWKDVQAFPSNKKAFSLAAFNEPVPYYGGQKATAVMLKTLDGAPYVPRGPHDQDLWNLFNQAATDLTTTTKSGDSIWSSTQAQAKVIAAKIPKP